MKGVRGMFHWICFPFAADKAMQSQHPPSPLHKGETNYQKQLTTKLFHDYEQERTLAENHPLRHHDTHGDSHHLGHHLVHRHDELKIKEGASSGEGTEKVLSLK